MCGNNNPLLVVGKREEEKDDFHPISLDSCDWGFDDGEIETHDEFLCIGIAKDLGSGNS